MPIQLVITNIGFIFSLVTCFSLGVLVFIRRPKEGSSPNIVFFLFSIAICAWIVSYALGINLHNPEHSRLAFMFNMTTLYLAILSAHLILIITGRLKGQEKVLKYMYAIATALVAYFIAFPDSFMLLSVSRLYLPNFLVPGPLYALQDIFFFAVTLYLFAHLGIAYHKADYVTRNRLKYFIVGFIYGYLVALVPEFLLYDIPVDPMPAAFMGLYTIPMAYAILKYDTIDMNFLAKRAFGYGLSIAGVTLLILFTGYANTQVHLFYPNFPEWVLPLISAVIAVIVGILVWHKVREVNLLKYQFVDVVTHKFRTPLTYIRWSLDTLRTANHSPEEGVKAVDAIANAHIRLSELTESLIGLSSADDSQFMYTYMSEQVRDVVGDAVTSAASRIAEKGLVIENTIPQDFPLVHIDRKKIFFAFQMVIDNAITYSPEKGVIKITAQQKNGFAFISIKDSGIGITEIDRRRLFSKFFRGSNAMATHTEGLGIGLYLSRDILQRHGGDLQAESEGAGKGSTFIFKIPLVR
ncbi:MAG: Phosphate regulon sensor protein PhoR (SphS) [Parcubacteria bacterium C7867-002]|nr:MAG: Phosphate regulon sensor protein PhoR (SphS) [Parcubacteria bacterium C7867-002]